MAPTKATIPFHVDCILLYIITLRFQIPLQRYSLFLNLYSFDMDNICSQYIISTLVLLQVKNIAAVCVFIFFLEGGALT